MKIATFLLLCGSLAFAHAFPGRTHLNGKDIYSKPQMHFDNSGVHDHRMDPQEAHPRVASINLVQASDHESAKQYAEAEDVSKNYWENFADEQNADGRLGATAVFLSLTVLISLTLIFEIMKDMLLEYVEGSRAEVMVEVVFSELTVLGFIGFVSFIMEKTPLFDYFSTSIWRTPVGAPAGLVKENGSKFEEGFEIIHVSMFVTICFFLGMVVMLVYAMKTQEGIWKKAEALVSQPDNIVRFLEDVAAKESSGSADPNWLSKNLRLSAKELDYNLTYLAMRAEFISPRDASPNLPYDFDFADYLAHCAGDEMAEICEIPLRTWGVLYTGICIVYFMLMVTRGSPIFLYWFMAGMQYFNVIVMQMLLSKCDLIRSQLVPLRSGKQQRGGGKKTQSLSQKRASAMDDRPMPAYLDQAPVTWRSPVAKYFLGDVPNLQEQLFWFDRCGPGFIQDYTRFTLLFLALYVPIVCTQFLRFIEEMDGPGDILWIVLKFFIAFVPWSISTTEIMNLAAKQDITNIEMMRNKEIIEKVKASQLGKRMVKLFQVLNKLRMNAQIESDADIMSNPGAAGINLDEIDIAWRTDVEATFDSYDVDGSGDLSEDEILRFLKSLGEDASMEKATALCRNLDVSGNNKVSCDEFVAWLYIQKERNAGSAPQSMEDIAFGIFHLFDADDGGTVTRDEMESTLATHGIELDYDEMSTLMKELDPNGDGHISLDEFQGMMEKYNFEP